MAKKKGPTPKGGRLVAPPTRRPCLYCGRKTSVPIGENTRQNSQFARMPHSPDATRLAPACRALTG